MSEAHNHGHDEHVTEEVHESHEAHAETPWEIITDPPHLIAEMFFEGVFLVLSALWIKWKLRKRDIEHAHC